MNESVRISKKKYVALKKDITTQTRKSNYSQPVNYSVDRILFLQRTLGNQAVSNLIKSRSLQAKLGIGAHSDKYEQEADRVRTTSDRNLENDPNIDSHIHSLNGGGQPLSEDSRAFFEPRLGYDLRQVRVHTDMKAADSARALNAEAFTIGKNVVFGQGRFAPETSSGKNLLAHELTHVVQQNPGTISKKSVSRKEKEQIANRIIISSINRLQKTVEDKQNLEPFNKSSLVFSTRTGVIQRVAGADDAAIAAVLYWCASGAAVTVVIDEILQVGGWLIWGSGSFAQNWCKTLFSALFGCVFGMAGGAMEKMIFQDAAALGTVGFLRWAQRRLYVAGYTYLAGKMGLTIAKLGCK